MRDVGSNRRTKSPNQPAIIDTVRHVRIPFDRDDCGNLEKTITEQLVHRLMRWNWPGIDPRLFRFRIEVDWPDVESCPAAMRQAWEMGLKIRAADVRDLSGASASSPREEFLIEFNRIENVMLATEDSGGIHFATMNQLAAPNLIANNLVANIWGWRQLPGGKRQRHIARGIYLDWFTASTRVENNIVFNTFSGGLQFNAGDGNEFVNNVVVGDTTRWDKHWRGANAQGTIDERNLVVESKEAPTPLSDPARGDFTLVKDFPNYPAGFQWIDVRQIGLDGTTRRSEPLSTMAREGGVLNWDSAKGVEIRGPWERKTAVGMWGLYNFNYLMAEPTVDAAITFTLPIRGTDRYAVRLSFPTDAQRASNARVEIEHAGGTTIERIDQRAFGFGVLLGVFDFAPGKPARVTISTAEANGSVAIEGIGFARTPVDRCTGAP